MKIQKIILIAGALLLTGVLKSSAQEWYFGLGGGYGFPVAGLPVYDETENYSSSSNSNSGTFNSKSLSFGKGVNFGMYGGYMLTKNMGFELGVSYLDGGKTTATFSDVTNYSTTTEVQTYNGTSVRIIPAFRLQAGEGRIRPYSVFGAIVGLGTGATATGTSSPSTSYLETGTFSGGYSFGFHGALGIRVMFAENVALFAEIALNYQSYSPATEMVTSNGGNSETISYSSSGTFSSSSNSSTVIEPQVYLPFSSLGVNVGVHISFNKQLLPAVKQPAPAIAPKQP